MRDLANLFGVYDPDPRAREAIQHELDRGGLFDEIFCPVPGWVVAVSYFPGTLPDSTLIRENRMVFAEGREDIVSPAGEGSRFWKKLGEEAEDSPNHLGTYSGDFGFVRFAPQGRATIFRSCAGLVPFYTWHGSARMAFSTRLGDLLEHAKPEVSFDPLTTMVWTAQYGIFPDQRTFFRGISLVKRGHYAVLEPHRGIITNSYWNPRSNEWKKPSPSSEKEHAERLRTILLHRLQRELGKKNLLTLSGGVDSSSLAVLSAGTLGRTVGTWTYFPQNQVVYDREKKFVEAVAGHVPLARRWELRTNGPTKIDLLRTAPRVCFPLPHPALGALPAIHEEWPVDVLFGGEFGDEACGSVFTLPDWCDALSLPEVLWQWNRWPTSPRNLGGWLRRRAEQWVGKYELPYPLELPGFVRPEIRAEYQDWREEEERKIGLDARPWRFFSLRSNLDGFAVMNWEACSALRIRRCFPFYNRQVLELVYECHPTELIGPGWKKLLKKAMRDDLPELIRLREDRGHWGRGYVSTVMPGPASVTPEMKSWMIPEAFGDHPLPENWACSLEQLSLFMDTVHRRISSGKRLS